MNETEYWRAEYKRLLDGLHQLVVARQAAVETGQVKAAEQLDVQIIGVKEALREAVARLRDLESPGAVLTYLDQWGDALLKAPAEVAQAIGEFAVATGSVTGQTVANALMPLLIPLGLLVLVVAYAAPRLAPVIRAARAP